MSGGTGQIALAVAGGIAGFFTGGVAWVGVGMALGGMAGSLIWPGRQNAPRLNDTSVQGARYGTMRPIVFGTVRVGGIGMGQGSTVNGPNKFTEEGEGGGGKGGDSGPSSYRYKLSYFNELCEGPIGGVKRRWENGRLVTDATGEDPGYNAVVYLGDNEQLPDPTMETIYGEGEVCPMRGVAYESVTERDITENGGGTRPNTEYEVFTEGGPIPWRMSEFAAWDEPMLNNWLFATGFLKGNVITAVEMDNSGTTDGQINVRKWTLDGEQIGETEEFAITDSIADFAVYNAPVFGRWYGFPNEVHWYYYNEAEGEITQGLELGHGIAPGNCFGGVYMDGHIYLVVKKTTDQYLMKFEAPGMIPGAFVAEVALGQDNNLGTPTFGASDTGHIYVTRQPNGGAFGVVLQRYFADTLELDHQWDEDETSLIVDSIGRSFYVKGDLICKAFTPSLGVYNIQLVKINEDLTLETYGETIANGNSQSIYLGKNLLLDNVGVYSLNPPAGPVILGDIVTAILLRCGVLPEKIDMDDLTQEVRGFIIGAQMTGWAAIDTLRRGFFFDVTEIDGKIVGRNRGHDAVAAIPDEDLCAHVPGTEKPEPLETVRTPEAELPRTVFVNYYDFDHDYQRGSQYWRRTTTFSQSDVTLDLSIVLTHSEAMQCAQWHMHYAWLERDQFVFYLTDAWCRLRPTDVVVVRGINIRITSITESPDGILKCEGVRAFAGPYATPGEPTDIDDGVSEGAPPSGQPPQEPPAAKVPTQLVLMDIPVPDSLYGFKAAMGPANNEGPWSGAALYKSLDGGTSWIKIADSTRRGVIGRAATALDDYAGSLAVVDDTSTVQVVLTDEKASLASVTEDGLDNGANLTALRSGAAWELLNFRDATLSAAKTYDLEGFYRGRNGTDGAIDDHAIDDTFVLLSTAITVDAPASELNVELLYKAVTYGTALADAVAVAFTNTGQAGEEVGEGLDPMLPSNAAGYVLVGANAALPNHRVITAGTNVTFDDDGPGSTLTINASGGGGGAPTNAQYLTMATDATLTHERVATSSANITLTDAGAGSTVTFDLTTTGVSANLYGDSITVPQIGVDKYGRIVSVTPVAIVGQIHTLDEGSSVDSNAIALNFVGAGVTATDAGSGVTTITIPGGGAASLPLNTYTSSHTLDAGDDGCIVEFDSSSACVCTVPTGLPSEFACQITQSGTGAVSVAASGSTIQSYNNALTLAGRYASATLSTVGSDTFNLAGNITPVATGTGIPSGGSTGQALVKSSGTDYDVTWSTVSATPGGSNTQVQFNNSGAFGGSSSFTWSGTRLSPNYVTLAAGTTSAGTSPLKFTSGSLMTTAEAGAVEFLSDKWYATITSGAARKEVALWDAAATSGRIPYVTTNGRLVDSANFTWDESNVRLTVGSGGTSASALNVQGTANGETALRVETTSNGTAARASVRLYTNSGALTGNINATAAGWTTTGYADALVVSAPRSGGLVLAAEHASGQLRFLTNNTERGGIDQNGCFVAGIAGLTTSSTNGDFYIPSCAGTPTGVPTSKTDHVAMRWDRTNKKLYVYDGGWNAMN